MLKKVTPIAISSYFSYLVIEKCFSFLNQKLKLVIENDFALAIASGFISLLLLFIALVVLYKILDFAFKFLYKFFLDQFGDIKQMYLNIKNKKKGVLTGNTRSLSNDTLNYEKSIELIKKSTYGLFAKKKAIEEGKLKDNGGRVETQNYGLNHWIQGGTREVYIPSVDDDINQEKERIIYIQILQEFDKSINEISVIDRNKLIIFLTEKQKEFF